MQNKTPKTYLETLVTEKKFKSKKSLIEYVLLNVLHFESTEERKCDRLDFKDISILTIKNVLDAVYLAGQMSAKN